MQDQSDHCEVQCLESCSSGFKLCHHRGLDDYTTYLVYTLNVAKIPVSIFLIWLNLVDIYWGTAPIALQVRSQNVMCDTT